MANNIEIKAYANDFAQQRKLAEQLSDQSLEVLQQADTFFQVERGRLKLREFPAGAAQLIYYLRDDSTGPTLSNYQISDSNDPQNLKRVLSDAYGVRCEVHKTRYLYMSGRTRLHFDQVEQLGDFIELEVVLSKGDSVAEGEQEADRLMLALGIQPSDLIDVAYADLLVKQQHLC